MGGSKGATRQLPYYSRDFPSSVPPWAPVPLGARYAVMLQLSGDRGPWFPGHGVVQTQQWGIYSGHAEGPPPRRSFCNFFSPFVSASHLSLLLLLTLSTFSTLCHPHHLCLLSPRWGSGHQDLQPSCRAGWGLEQWGGRAPDIGGITGTRCHPGSVAAVQEMTGTPIFPMGHGG